LRAVELQAVARTYSGKINKSGGEQIQLINFIAQNKADYFISAIKIPETGTVKTEILLSLFK
jgi:hypothetical protein